MRIFILKIKATLNYYQKELPMMVDLLFYTIDE
jgi:hypothetical protein